jgi:GntR family transcriptional regulator, colanic acid and biofilm gene transcriptional regulator
MVQPAEALRSGQPSDARVGRFGQPVSKETLSQQAYQAIRTSLMRSRLKPGQKLVAREVARDLGISVTPVRESLLRLVSEHGLVMDDHGTVMVPPADLQRCVELRDLRMLVEGEGAARAAQLATRADVEKLAQIHRRYLRPENHGDFSAALAENENFHFTLCRIAQSPALFRLVENLWIQFGPVLGYLYDGRGRPFHGRKHAHVLVIESLNRRDPEAARAAIARDILVGGAAILERLPRDGTGAAP